MGSETKSNGAASGFKEKMLHYVYSGEKKHVMVGIGIVTLIFGVPWYLMTQGTKQLSHQDYMDKADKARKALSLIVSGIYQVDSLMNLVTLQSL